MGARLCRSHSKRSIVLPEQSACAKLIKSLFQRGTLSRFICHYLIACAKHAGRSKCVGLPVSPSVWNGRHFIHFLIMVPNSRVVRGWFIYTHGYLSVHFPFSSIVHSTNTHETESRCRTHRDDLGKIPPPVEVETHRGRATWSRRLLSAPDFHAFPRSTWRRGRYESISELVVNSPQCLGKSVDAVHPSTKAVESFSSFSTIFFGIMIV